MTSTTLHFLSYNVHLFLGTVVGNLDLVTKFLNKVSADVPRQEYEDSGRLDSIIAEVQKLNPDIVGFSEVWANDSKKKFISALKSQLEYSAWDKNEDPLEIGSGLLLLSRFPLSNVSFTKYNKLSGSDSKSQKGFLIATAKIDSQKLLIVHTHTQADDNNDAIEARKQNINQLHSSISSAADRSIPVILLGDLNITGENESGTSTKEYEFLCDILKQSQMFDSYRTLNPNTAPDLGYTCDAVHNKLIKYFAPNDAKNKVRQRLDYMFARGITPTSVTVPKTFTFQTSDGTMDLSDHYPLDGHFLLP
ncbi:MAG: endonuclease/exonuclease/phosphatase family protein [Nostoc sp.]|uniref:endonuclease/exonuclease/phosphatase family protein n=1 Tax=Nostoc sp. TaxID=1180 RepID=UPI002FFAF728